MGKNILISSLLFSEEAMLKRSGIGTTPAARRWLLGFSRGVRHIGYSTYFIGHEITSYYPKGDLMPGNIDDVLYGHYSRLVRYINLWPIRGISLSHAYTKAYCDFNKERKSFKYVISYNASRSQISLGRKVKKINANDTKWILITLDHDNPSDDFSDFLDKTKSVDYFLFLSQWAYNNFPLKNKYLLEGGIDLQDLEWRYAQQIRLLQLKRDDERQVILYSGMFAKWGGVDLLIKAFLLIKGDFELWICGFGNNENVVRAAKHDSRVKLFGMVSEQELQDLSLRASVFVNPRPLDIDGNLMNFPSKLLEYLTYCKPVVSTKTAGLPDEYGNVCFLVDDSIESIKRGLLKATSLSEECLLDLADKTYSFLKCKTWESQVEKLDLWIESQNQ